MADIHVRIGSIAIPAGRRLDADDLGRRVERELAELLALDPIPALSGRAGEPLTIAAPGGQVHAASAATAASVAHAIARRVHAGLKEGGRP